MCLTHITHVCRIHVWAGAVGGGLSLLEVVPPCIQGLIQLPETGLQLARLACRHVRTLLGQDQEGKVLHVKTLC